MSTTGDRPHRVAVLVRDGLIPFEVGIPHRILGQARSSSGSALYDVRTCSVRPGDVRTDTDLTLGVSSGPELLDQADTVILPAADTDYGPPTQGRVEPALAAALGRVGMRRRSAPGVRVASICTGAFVLAAVGLLDERTVTTHWRSVSDFRALYPGIRLAPDVLYTDDAGSGPGFGSVLTAAGEAAGIDLCLHMIRTDHGAAVANEVARGTVVPPHRDGGQAQYLRRPIPDAGGSTTADARAWALAHLDQQIDLADLAARESVSPRTLVRRFRAETGLSPIRWLAGQRMDRARELLERTDHPIDRIAGESGFGSGTALREHFRAELGVSPRAYRRTFRGPATP